MDNKLGDLFKRGISREIDLQQVRALTATIKPEEDFLTIPKDTRIKILESALELSERFIFQHKSQNPDFSVVFKVGDDDIELYQFHLKIRASLDRLFKENKDKVTADIEDEMSMIGEFMERMGAENFTLYEESVEKEIQERATRS